MAIIDYSKEASLARMLNNLQEEDLFKKVTDSSVAAMFLKAVAKENEHLVIGCLANIQETSFDHAVNESSVLAQTKILEYTPHRKVGAIGTVAFTPGPDFTVANNWSKGISIPIGTTVSVGGLTCTVTESSIIPANYEVDSDPFETSVVQGYPQVVNYTSIQTEDYASIVVAGDSIEENNLFVWVNGILWSQEYSLRSSIVEADKIYTVTTLADEAGISINFGNELFGKRIEESDEVRVMYFITEGASGNIASLDIIDKVTSTIYDVEGTTVEMACSNTTALIGGEDYESLESIRLFAPANQQVKSSVNSIPEFEEYLNSGEFSFLDKVVVWGASEVNQDNQNAPGTYIASEENKVYVAGISYEGNQASDYESTIRESLDTRKGPTVLVQIEDVNRIYVRFTTQAYVRDQTYTLNAVRVNIETALSEAYTLQTQEFKEGINNSQYVAIINTADGLHHHTTSLDFFKQETLTGRVIPIGIYMEDITPLATKLYMKHSSEDTFTLVGETVEDTTYVEAFVGVNSPTDVSGGIDLRFGVGTVTIDESFFNYSEDEYEYRLTFDTLASDAILTKRNQILTFGISDAVVTYEGIY